MKFHYGDSLEKFQARTDPELFAREKPTVKFEEGDPNKVASPHLVNTEILESQPIDRGLKPKSILKSSVEYHKKFLDGNINIVKSGDLSKLQSQAQQISQEHKLSILSKAKQLEIAKELNLPPELVPLWRVENALYQIYYIPGYDNWLFRKVKQNPEELNRISSYKRSFIEGLLRQRENNNQSGIDLPHVYKDQIHRINSLDAERFSKSQFNQSGFYPAKRNRDQKTGDLNLSALESSKKLKSGTEFWQTTYQNSIRNPYQNTKSRLMKPNIGPNGYHSTQCRTQVTEYNFSYGKLGSNPRSIMPPAATKKPLIDDHLK